MPTRNRRNRNKKKKRKAGSAKHPKPNKIANKDVAEKEESKETLEDLQFEDPVPDDVAEEEIVRSLQNTTLDDEEEEEDMETSTQKSLFRPGVDEIKQGEELQYDSNAYTTNHKLKMDWPCLSVDILRDNLGEFRTKYPQTLYFACGTQSSNGKNKVSLLKVSELHRTKHDDADDEQNSDSEAEDLDDDPIVEEKSFDHPGGTNRLRSMPQSSSVIATWSENGNVYVWDTRHYFKALDTPPSFRLPRQKAIHTFSGHSDEGFAMDWSPRVKGRLLTGDCNKHIYLWEMHDNGSGWHVNKAPFQGHQKSVEDLQWSPVEDSVFASCSVDRTIQIWDVRTRGKPQLRKKAHKNDVNVISWNKKNANFIVSGSDDQTIKIWDLRRFAGGTFVGRFNWHKGPITSVDWHPTEDTIFCASSEDNSISVWDLSVENDPDGVPDGAQVPNDCELPPQLMFLHLGQTEIKEVHFHPQIKSLLVSTASDGIDMFKPENL